MTHEVIRHLLDDYVTGELAEDARAPVAEHVAACEICAEEVSSLQRVLARAADLPKSIDPPPEAWDNIRAAILKDEAALDPAHRQLSLIRRHPLLVVLAASIVVAILSSAGTARYLNSRASPAGNRAPTPAATCARLGR